MISPSLPKKNFLVLLSIPKILNPFFAKKTDYSDPTNPHEPVIKAIRIKSTPLNFCFLLTIYRYRKEYCLY